MTVGRANHPRILYVGTLPPHQGGSAIMAGQLLAGLAASGHEIEAISPITERALSRGDPFARRNPALGVLRFTMPYLDNSPDAPPSPEYLERERAKIESLFERAIAKRHTDVIVIGRESFAPHVVHLARRREIPSVLLFQGATTMGILNGTYPQPQARRLLESARKADLAVTCAEHMREVVTKFGLTDVSAIPNPVDLDRFRRMIAPATTRRALGLSDLDVVVMHLSNLKPLKRSHDLVRAAALATRKERRLSFVVVGDGPGRRELEDLCDAEGVAQRFRFTGWVEHERVPELINCSDIVALPSAGEAQALVYLEAQACERTLVSSDIPAAREVIEDGRTGLLHRTADISDLSAKLVMAAQDEDLRARIGPQAREAVRTHALQRVVSRYGELLEAVASNR